MLIGEAQETNNFTIYFKYKLRGYILRLDNVISIGETKDLIKVLHEDSLIPTKEVILDKIYWSRISNPLYSENLIEVHDSIYFDYEMKKNELNNLERELESLKVSLRELERYLPKLD